MSDPSPRPPVAPATRKAGTLLRYVRRLVFARFSLRNDAAAPEAIDASLRAGSELTGANAWILIFAIFIASIGLNVNSTAVIIGAMLVSPLMGPIMGVGYGVAIYDFALIRSSLLNLIIAAVISLCTSTVYFVISPLAEAQSELLARTTPTIWDVLIALFGGLAGIVGATRKEKTNVIPGVAIATALMPPLCTAGYGLAKGNIAFFVGAFYLFALNSVFITFSTVVILSLLKLPHRHFVDAATERTVRRRLYAVVIVAALPSFYLANRLVQSELFNSRARQFAQRELKFENSRVTDLEISPAERRIEFTLLGDPISAEVKASIERRLPEAGLSGALLVIHQSRAGVDVATLRQGIMSDLFREGLDTAKAKDDEIARLRMEITKLVSVRSHFAEIAQELEAQYPQLQDVLVGEGLTYSDGPDKASRGVIFVSARSEKALTPADLERIQVWLKIRAKVEDVRFITQVVPPAKPPRGNKARPRA